MNSNRLKIGLVAALVILVSLSIWVAGDFGSSSQQRAYSAPGLEPISAEAARDELFTLLPALLLVVYDAFGQTEEAEIYDTLAVATTGDALDALYLERAGAMVGGGLTETDQTIHEMRLLAVTSQQFGDTFEVAATWEVIGTVGHSEHLHIRGNTYQADLTLAPAEGAWKITDFELKSVDRQAAGEFIAAEPS